jgi:hypothetical protein
MGLKELQSWRLVRLEHRPGDRRDFFSAPEDVWQIFKTLAEERQRREVDPTLSMLRDALLETAGSAEDADGEPRPADPRAHPVRGQHQLPHPVSDHHHRARLGAAVLQAALAATARRTGWMPTSTWVKVFALTFALGVVSGVTMSFQFGTNWPGYMKRVGNVAGPLLAYEVLTAFFLEATFLGIMLFGRGRVSRPHAHAGDLPGGLRHHAVGVLDPGAELVDADTGRLRDDRRQAHVTELVGGRLQPLVSLPADAHAAGLRADGGLPDRRLSPPTAGCAATAAQTCRRRCAPACCACAAADPAADRRGRSARPEHAGAPAGQDRRDGRHLADERGAALRLFALPDEATRSNRFEIAMPNLASLILTHDWTARCVASMTSNTIRRWRRCSGLSA